VTDDDWSIRALKAHYDQLFADERRFLREVVDRIDARHAQFDQQAQRLQTASNEWRGALNDRERSTVTRVEWEAKNKSLEEKFDQAISNTNALLSAMSHEMRDGNLKLENLIATMGGGKLAREDLRVWVLGALASASVLFNIVMTIYATSR